LHALRRFAFNHSQFGLRNSVHLPPTDLRARWQRGASRGRTVPDKVTAAIAQVTGVALGRGARLSAVATASSASTEAATARVCRWRSRDFGEKGANKVQIADLVLECRCEENV